MIYSETESGIIAADSLQELTYKQKRMLLASQNGGADAEKYAQTLIKTVGEGVYNKVKEKFRDKSYRGKVLANLDKKGITCVTLKSAGYPSQLAALPVPPLVLYAKGNTKLLRGRMFGVVGSRRTPAPVLEECKRVCAAVAEHIAIVTGVADGADSAAIRGALESGNVICVLPGGHDNSGAADLRLLKKVEERGLVLSEFPPYVKVQRHTFHLRNRIIAGLSEGVLVVSAGKKSGALSTAAYAADYSKELFAFPYGIGATQGEGCNNLIKHGAMLCDGVQDMLEMLKLEAREETEFGRSNLDGGEKAVYETLKREGEMHAEQLALTLGKTVTEVVTICAMLEINGNVIRVGGNKFAAI
ncbi:MAG: DNA-protecting protein DprA [Clostridia bacterium]|nr:DNA-protecting protein DprA [Clostridia bacterium]